MKKKNIILQYNKICSKLIPQQIKIKKELETYFKEKNLKYYMGGTVGVTLKSSNSSIIIEIPNTCHEDSWGIQFHKDFCKDFNLKLIKYTYDYRQSSGYNKNESMTQWYEYTSKDNPNFEAIKTPYGDW